MLVLTFKEEEAVFVNFNGVEVKITIVQAGYKKTKLGIEAPREVEVVREKAKKQKKTV